MIQSATETGT